MRFPLLFVLLTALVGCATDDARLHGTWRSNRDATVDAAFRQNPSLANLPPDRLARFRDTYGHLAMTYSNGVAIATFRGQKEVWHYKVVKKGADFVVIQNPTKGIPDFKIRFVEGGQAYWVGGVSQFEERFDKIEVK